MNERRDVGLDPETWPVTAVPPEPDPELINPGPGPDDVPEVRAPGKGKTT